MRIYFHGNDCHFYDKGNATLAALVLILILSLVFLSLVPVITARSRLARDYKAEVLERIRTTNSELVSFYDLY
jgi:competence protein ComGC